MRILFVTPYPVSHVRVRAYGFVSQLARRHEVSVLALCSGERDAADMDELRRAGIAVRAIHEPRLRQYLRGLRAFAGRLPLQVAFGAAPALRAAIRETLASGSFDLLHVEFIRALGALPEEPGLPLVWDAVDCISDLYEQGARFGATPMLRLIGRQEARRVRNYERQQVQRLRHILVTSERDRHALLNLVASEPGPHAEVTALPHGVDRAYFQRYDGPREEETLVFSGKMSFHANLAAVQRLVHEILPLIWRERPRVRLLIAGSEPPASLRRLAQREPRISVSGYLPDLRPAIARARVSVSPLPYAVGIQNKILEALALGTPVVTSPAALAGLPALAGRDLLVADDPKAFAAATLRLLDDQDLWQRLSESGSAYVDAHHDWDAIIARLSDVYERAIHG